MNHEMDLRFTIDPDEGKFKELVLYIAEKSQLDPKFGRTKLNKILFYADFMAYRLHKRPITGLEYRALQKGPVPRRMPAILEQMKQAGILAEQTIQYYDLTQTRQIALRPADLSNFSGTEIALVDKIIQDLWDRNATGVSVLSHKFPGWKAAIKEEESIPYDIAYTSNTAHRFVEPPELLSKLAAIATRMGAFDGEEAAEFKGF